MKILLASLPADGHFNPLTGIAVHLRDRGHDVRWYAGPAYGSKIDRLDMPWFPYQRATEVMAGNLSDLFPERAALKGPKLISFDLDKFFVSQVENHFDDVVAIRDEWPFDVLLCDGAFYAEQLVVDLLGIPVYAVGLTTVMPDLQSPPPFFGLRPARTPIGKLQHAIVRKLLASGMKAGTIRYNEILGRHGMAPIALDGFPHEPMLRVHRVFLNGSPGLEFPGYRPLANAEYVGPLVPARRAIGPDTPLPNVVLDPTRKVVAVSQGTVDNGDPGKLIVPTIEALKGGDLVVVATTAGVRPESCAPDSRSRTLSSKTSSTMTSSSPMWRLSSPAAGSAATWQRSSTASLWWGPASARARTTSTPVSATTSSASTCGSRIPSRQSFEKRLIACSTTR